MDDDKVRPSVPVVDRTGLASLDALALGGALCTMHLSWDLALYKARLGFDDRDDALGSFRFGSSFDRLIGSNEESLLLPDLEI